jgi:hypothetical protein
MVFFKKFLLYMESVILHYFFSSDLFDSIERLDYRQEGTPSNCRT